ncbi:ERF family protein [Parvimonas sp. G1641]|uniref:ERF family protein n=1 Tax=Parvimonas sp. G1641 TaxID=3388846 RepID=UPI0039803452
MAEKTKNEISVLQKLQQARVMLQNKNLKKTGLNPFQKFNYFELGDFLPQINEIFNELKLYSHFNLYGDKAKLVIICTETNEQVQFTTPIQQVKENAKMQDIGAIHTYSKRYLYYNALEIIENDLIDCKDNSLQAPKQQANKTPKKEAPQPTKQPAQQKAPQQNLISTEQRETLINLIESAGINLTEELQKIKDLTTDRYDKALEYYTKLVFEKNMK